MFVCMGMYINICKSTFYILQHSTFKIASEYQHNKACFILQVFHTSAGSWKAVPLV